MPSAQLSWRTVTVRDMNRATDTDGVAALDTAFETSSVYDVQVTADSLVLVERPLATPMTKVYPIDDVFADWASWENGFVAVDDDGRISGFAAVEHEPWHARLILWHIYVAPDRRRAGVGRALLDRVEQFARELGCRRVWLETSNVNVPGIAAYRRLGYAMCGGDITFYDASDVPEETAIYLSKPV